MLISGLYRCSEYVLAVWYSVSAQAAADTATQEELYALGQLHVWLQL